MNLLKEGIEKQLVIKTTMTRKLTIDGITQAYPVYKVRLDCLYYNDQNDRIVTWISQYKSQNDGNIPCVDEREEYNKIIENFIVESNPEAIKKTQKNIELVDQREAGVVLSDGRIIDGNRRFTCLRRLKETNDRFSHFETVILDRNIEHSAKEIKMLELSIQHGEESKVDYNPIDKLVGIYHDIVETGLLTEDEYAKSTNESIGDIRRRIEMAKLMVEFLEFANAPKQFYIARDLQLNSILEELQKLIKKCHTPDEAEDLKICVFNNALMRTEGDRAKFVRDFKNIINSDYQQEFIEEQKQLAIKINDCLPTDGTMSADIIREIVRTNSDVVEAMERSCEKVLTKAKKTAARNLPIQQLEKATMFIEDIDVNIVSKMNDSEYIRFERQLKKLEASLQSIKELL